MQPSIRVKKYDINFTRERLRFPFGFKGSYLTELWQTVVKLSTENHDGYGVATQSPLYGDALLFSSHSQAGTNALMFGITGKALQLITQNSFNIPIDLLNNIYDEVAEYARQASAMRCINRNFVLNALVAADNAVWMLYAAANGISNFDDMLPQEYRCAFGFRNSGIAILFQVSYDMTKDTILQAIEDGYFIIKIKLGQPGSQETMLEQDIKRFTEIHDTLKLRIKHRPIYYTIDCNGRYEKKETLKRLLHRIQHIGAAPDLLFIEEPFPDTNEETVYDIEVPVAADESADSVANAQKRIKQGYKVIVLKAIAKTLSLTIQIAKMAYDNNIPCVCSDLTVNPLLLEWHKNIAGRLAPFPGINMPLLETNGSVHYINWDEMYAWVPSRREPWSYCKNGVYELNDDFFALSGGIFLRSGWFNKILSA